MKFLIMANITERLSLSLLPPLPAPSLFLSLPPLTLFCTPLSATLTLLPLLSA